jgi:hypothetical protein
MPERGAGFQPQRLHFAHHVEHRLEVALLRSAPRRAHAEARGAGGLGGLGGDQHVVQIEQALVFHPGVVARRLRAVAAVLGAAAGLDRQQGRELHRLGSKCARCTVCAWNIRSANGKANSASIASTERALPTFAPSPPREGLGRRGESCHHSLIATSMVMSCHGSRAAL